MGLTPAETNRKCPRWAEFNSGNPPATPGPSSATSPPATSPTVSRGPDSLFSPVASTSGALRPPNALAHGPSPLAMSPPMNAMDGGDDYDDDDDDDDDGIPATPSHVGPKIKFSLK